MRGLKKIVALALAVAMTITSVGVMPTANVQAAAKIKVLNGTKQSLIVGDDYTIYMKGFKANQVKFSSSSSKIAKVSAKGKVKGVKPGKATITIKAKTTSAKAKVTLTVEPGTVKSVTATTPSSSSVKVSWKKQSGVTGYQILQSTKKSSGYKVVKTVKGASKSSATITGLSNGGTFYYKVCAYKTIGSKKVKGESSKVASVKVWKLVWSDEFNYTDKNKVLDNWTYEMGNGVQGWGNNELQHYTNGNNVLLTGSALVIQPKYEYLASAKREVYTSTRMVTKNKKSFKYGKIEFRCKVPSAQGTWAATWMLGTNGGWPGCGEIDVMETLSNTNTGLFALDRMPQTIHCPRFNGMPTSSGPKNRTTTVSGSTTGYHTYGIIWDSQKITFTIDGKETWTYDPKLYGEVTAQTWPFDYACYMIMNVAIGGTLGGSRFENGRIVETILDKEAITGEAGRMYVDYVRVWQ